MRAPRNLGEALRRGFHVTDQTERGVPERSGRTRGKLKLVLDVMNEKGPGCYEIAVPYIATYHFGKPRPARVNEKFS